MDWPNHSTRKSRRQEKKRSARNNWMHNISKWTDISTSELTRMTEDREKWKKFVVDTCLMIPPTIQESREKK